MSLDVGPIVDAAAMLVEHLRREYGEDAELGDVVVVAEVRLPPLGDDRGYTVVHAEPSSPRAVVNVGLLELGLEAVREQ